MKEKNGSEVRKRENLTSGDRTTRSQTIEHMAFFEMFAFMGSKEKGESTVHLHLLRSVAWPLKSSDLTFQEEKRPSDPLMIYEP